MKTLAPRRFGVLPALFLAAHAAAGVSTHRSDSILSFLRRDPGKRSS